MSIAKCYCAHLEGLSTKIITVEVDISNGLHALSVVGLGDRAIGEAKDRICAAIKNSGYTSPKQKNQKVIISLAPADIRKEGTAFDLAMALGYLLAAGEVSFDADKTVFLGELSLEGNVRKVAGVLPILCELSKLGFTSAYIPAENCTEASLADGIAVYGVSSLQEIISFLKKEKVPEPIRAAEGEAADDAGISSLDMRWVRGNEVAKRALEIAAAGAHNILMYGPPGTGKTMLAQSFCSILPPLTREEMVEVTSIHSAARILESGPVTVAPFRAPHHTISYPGMVGGGGTPRPGEITLAHRGVLFLDELPEFDRTVLEALREPLESRSVTIARARGSVTFPAQCIFLASMNPCRCGRSREQGCECTTRSLGAYRRKISGPIMDRIDIWINIQKVDYAKLSTHSRMSESSAAIRSRVTAARLRQCDRFKKLSLAKRFNSEMSAADIETCLDIEQPARAVLALAAEKMELSGRSYHKMIKVAQTIADLNGSNGIKEGHVLEALQYRQRM